jgi:general secretion pathway protein J
VSVRSKISSDAAEAGFTLLELLIATTVLAFLTLLLFGGLRFGARVWEKAQTSTTDTNRVRAAQLFLSDETAQIYPFFVGDTPANKHVQFEGEERRMTFLSPSKSVPGAMDWVTIQAVPAKDGISVDVTSQGELTGGHGPVTRHALIGGFRWFQISYYGAPAPAGSTTTVAHPQMANAGLGRNAAVAPAPQPQWTSVWIGQQTLPTLIRFRAAFEDKSEWPDLVISPRIDVDEACVIDQLTKYCQGR